MIVISHDRDLLDTSVNFILSLENTKLTLYRGGYSDFEKLRNERLLLDQKAAKKQEEKRKHLQTFVDRFKAKASKARQAQSRVKMLEKMGTIEPVVDDATLPIVFPEPAKALASPILACQAVTVGYGDRPVLRKLDLRIDADDRIGLLGSNGNGKSTFAKLVSQRLEPMSGEVTRPGTLSVGYFAQHQTDELVPERSVVGHVRVLMPDAPEAKVRGVAARFGFSGERAETPVASLSGGEKARLLLGLATFHAPQLLVLDEPTNHLDIDARASLVEAINEFPGAVILVSHDRWLLEACADRLWLVKDGTVRTFDGDLDDYRRLVLAEARGEDSGPERKPEAAARAASTERKASVTALRKKVESIEAEIARLQKRLAGIDALLADPKLFQREPAKGAELAKLRKTAAAALEAEEEAWLQAQSELERVA
jgi:ATP-binding cassette subfamily F protein 3